MSSLKPIQIQGITDVGCVRAGNEDCFLIQPLGRGVASLNADHLYELGESEALFVAVSDGMGGAAAGELASQTGLETLGAYVQDHSEALTVGEPRQIMTILERGVREANAAILEKAREIRTRRGMGATITALFLKRDVIYLLQVGDSRAYVLRDGKLVRITRDQSFVGHLVEMGTITEAQAMKHPQRSVILQALGTQEVVKTDLSYLELCKDDVILLCSDGLYSEFLPEDLEERVLPAAKLPLSDGVHALVEEAKNAGGKDNITVIGIKVHDNAPERAPGEEPGYQPFPFLDRDNPLEKVQSLFQ